MAVILLQLCVVVPHLFSAGADRDVFDASGSLLYLVLITLLNLNVYLGKNWARMLTLVLFVAGAALVLLLPLTTEAASTPPSALDWGLALGGLLLEGVAVYFLFTRPGAAWFRRSK